MAPKAKKGKQLSPEKEASDPILWPDLPRKLLYFIARQKGLMIRNISWGGISKSWKVISKQCSPRGEIPPYQLSSNNDDSKDNYLGRPLPHILSIPYLPGSYVWMSRRRGPEPWRHFQGCSHGLIVAAMDKSNNCTLYDPFWSWWSIPTWDDKIPFKFATLSSYPRDPNHSCRVMVLTGMSRPAFVISRIRSYEKWTPHDCTLVDPYAYSENQTVIFTNAIGFKGKFYALTLQGALALIEEEVDSQFKITAFGKNRAVPSLTFKHFIEYLFESYGEILLAFLISRTTKEIFDEIEVFRLDLAKLSWVKMESHGDRTLFLGTNCCMSVYARQVGCKANCVYFTHHTIKGWKEFHMRTGTIQPCYDMDSLIESPALDEPISIKN